LITYLANRDDDNNYDGNFFYELEMQLWDDWQGNGYNGLDYKIMTNFKEGQKVVLKNECLDRSNEYLEGKILIITEIVEDWNGLYNLQLEDDYPIGKTIQLKDDQLELRPVLEQSESLF